MFRNNQSFWGRLLPGIVIGSLAAFPALSARSEDNPAEAKPAEVQAEKAPEEKGAAEKAPEADLDLLVKQLDSASFGERQTASNKLNEAGIKAFPALEKAAAATESREVITRAIDILAKGLRSGDEGTRKEAKSALDRLAAGGATSAARRAQEVLKQAETPAPQAVPGIAPGGIRIGGGNVQIQVQAIGGGRRVKIQNVNGVKEIEAEENGQKVKISDDPANGIKMEITETKDGKETVKKIEAKNEDDLKKNHPDAHKIYEKYSKQGGVQIQFGGGGIGGPVPALPRIRAFPGRAGGIRLGNPEEDKKQLEGLDGAKKKLEEAAGRLKKLGGDSPSDDLKKAIEEIEQAQKQIETARKSIEESQEAPEEKILKDVDELRKQIEKDIQKQIEGIQLPE